MKYMSPSYEKAIFETQDVIAASGYSVETKEDGSGLVKIAISKLFG